MKILLAANMYPSNKYPHYGIFVKNTEEILKTMENVQIKKVVIKKTNNLLVKILSYALFYVRIVLYVCAGRYDVLYGHFLSHISLPIIVARKINKKIKIVVNVHGNDVVPDQKKDEKWEKIIRKAIPLINYIIVPSDYFLQIMQTVYNVKKNSFLFSPQAV